MAPLPYNNTDIAFVDYTVGPVAHTAQVRVQGVTTPASFGDWFKQLLIAIGPNMYASAITSVRIQVLGTDYSVPWVGTTLEGYTWGASIAGVDQTPLFATFVGRGTTGRRCRMTLYGYKSAISSFRVTSAENANVAAAIAVMNQPIPWPLDIAGTVVSWYSYVNTGYNAYWQRNSRTS